MTLYDKSDPQSIQKMFGSIAKQYDRTNAVLSLQMHRYWNSKLIEWTLLGKNPGTYLDLCCGTGEISLKYLKKNVFFRCHAFLLDFCPEMLFYAQERAKKLQLNKHIITYLQADAQEIPLPHESIDCMTMAYGIRNIPSPDRCFAEMHRVLKKEGQIGILELTQPENRLLRAGHSIYLNTVVPIMGRLITSNLEAYQYLCNSIKSFIKPKDLEKMLKTTGFNNIRIKPLMGGIATIIVAEK